MTLIRTELNDAGATDRAIAKLVKVLDADVYQDREAAAKELRLYGVRAVPALTITAKSHPSPEARERAEVLIDRINKASGGVPENGLYGEPLRQVRAVAVLERIGTPEAVLVLAEMRKLAGFPGTEATLAWQRLHAK